MYVVRKEEISARIKLLIAAHAVAVLRGTYVCMIVMYICTIPKPRGCKFYDFRGWS